MHLALIIYRQDDAISQMFIDESYIDRKYRLELFNSCIYAPKLKRINPAKPLYELECPLCGAPKSHLVWMPHKRTWKFLCSTKSRANCQSQMEFPVLLKAWCPELFLSYQRERFEAGTTGAGFNCPRPTNPLSRRPPLETLQHRQGQRHRRSVGIATT